MYSLRMNFEKSKEEFLKLFENIDENYKCRFARWVGGFCEGEIDKLPPTEIEETLNQIGDVLRQDIEAPGGKLKNEIVSFLRGGAIYKIHQRKRYK